MGLRVLLAFGQPILRRSLRTFLELGDLAVVGEAGDDDTVVELASHTQPEVVLLDMDLPRVPCMELSYRVLAANPTAKLLILACRAPEHPVEDFVRAGAMGFLSHEATPEELFTAIHALRLDQTYVSPSATRDLIEAAVRPRAFSEPPRFTHLEREILQLIAEGCTSKDVAERLGLTARRVESYRARLMERLEVSKVSALVRVAIRQGLVSL